MSENNNKQDEQHVSIWKVVVSVTAAMFGVRGSKARERDFTKGRPAAYIIVGLIFTVLFILTLVGVVTLVMKLAGV
jgi:hypothetical protein